MNEARGSWNGYFTSPAGNKDQFTLRQEDQQKDVDFILRIKQFGKDLAANGWKPVGGNGHVQPTPASKSETPSATERKPADESPPAGNTKTFDITSIQLAAGGAHPRWVVKGGNFTKFGVTCWPETLEAAGVAEKLDPLKENKPKGNWIAHYVERENDEGKMVPDKVVRLERKSK